MIQRTKSPCSGARFIFNSYDKPWFFSSFVQGSHRIPSFPPGAQWRPWPAAFPREGHWLFFFFEGSNLNKQGRRCIYIYIYTSELYQSISLLISILIVSSIIFLKNMIYSMLFMTICGVPRSFAHGGFTVNQDEILRPLWSLDVVEECLYAWIYIVLILYMGTDEQSIWAKVWVHSSFLVVTYIYIHIYTYIYGICSFRFWDERGQQKGSAHMISVWLAKQPVDTVAE